MTRVQSILGMKRRCRRSDLLSAKLKKQGDYMADNDSVMGGEDQVDDDVLGHGGAGSDVMGGEDGMDNDVLGDGGDSESDVMGDDDGSDSKVMGSGN
jgi:hypothetical protein